MIQSLCENAGLPLTPDQFSKLERLADLVIEKNKVLNLTRIENREDLMVKQILNSLYLGQFVELKGGFSVADLGTGGGFPGLPLAIAHPDCHFTLVDSVQKKIRAVEEFAKALGLRNVKTVSDRLEALGQSTDHREQYDVVTAQALAPLRVLLELAMPWVRVGGVFAAFKGPHYSDELYQAVGAIRVLKAGQPTVHSYSLPDGMGERHLLLFHKSEATPDQYPRKTGLPAKSPL
jgi:16S rRNA (guanine527-N7)-methyltransferase